MVTPSSGLVLPDATACCQNFPPKFTNEVQRTALVHTLDFMFSGETDLVILHGVEGMGKSTLLAQFARSHADRTISIFLRSSTRFGYDPELVAVDMCSQMNFLLGGIPNNAGTQDPRQLSKLIFALQQSCNRDRPFYFVVLDGLDEIPKEDAHLKDEIVALLPTGLPQFKFLCSGLSSRLNTGRLDRLKSDPLPQSPFTPGEAISFFGSSAESHVVEELYTVTKGVPGELATFRRILERGGDAGEALENLPKLQPQLFELEWSRVDAQNELQIHALAILAHDRTKHSISDIAALLNASPKDVRNTLTGLTFLQVPEDELSELLFVSDSYRKFVAIQLGDWKWFVNDRIIDHLLESPQSPNALLHLPDYLQKAGRNEQLVNYLNPDHFISMLEHSQSLGPVHQHAQLGLSAALLLKDDGEILRFGVQECAIKGMDSIATSRAEVRARVALGQYESAFALAHAAQLKQDRVRLLAALARAKRERDIEPEEELVEQVRQLLKEVDIRDLGDSATDLAIDLMYFMPDSAIKVVERMSKTADGRSMDLALARLSVSSAVAKEKEERQTRKIAESARDRIKDPELFKISTAMSLMMGEYSAIEVISESERLSNPIDRIYLLRQWALNCTEDEEALEVIEYAFRLAIQTAEYTPNATHVRELATPLPLIEASAGLERLVGLIDSQKQRLLELGPTQDFLRLQCYLVEAEEKYDRTAATARLLDCYLNIAQEATVVTRVTCLAHFLATLTRVDPERLLEATDSLHSLVESDLRRDVMAILKDTAEQVAILRGVFEALATDCADLAIEFAAALNTETRRDEAYWLICKTAVSNPIARIPFASLNKALELICDTEEQDDAVVFLLRRFCRARDLKDKTLDISLIVPFVNRATRIGEASLRTEASALGIRLLSSIADIRYEGLKGHLVGVLSESWDAIDDDWLRVTSGFMVCSQLADCSMQLASEYLDRTDQFRNELSQREEDSTYDLAVKLAVRAFTGLVRVNSDSESDWERIDNSFEKVPSIRRRLQLWSDLALKCFHFSRAKEGQRIVNDQVKPLLAKIREKNSTQWARSLTVCAPALYASHKALGLEAISSLPIQWRDLAFDEVIDYILRKEPSSEPFEASGNRYALTYEAAVDISDVLRYVSTDWVIYRHIENVVESSNWGRVNKFTVEQKIDIARRLEKIAQERLPTPRFIRHDGFRIIALAQLCRLRRISSEAWKQLEDAARCVPNSADRAMVLAILGKCCPEHPRQNALFMEAKSCISSIPCILDRADRLQILASECSDHDGTLCRQLLRDAFSLVPSEVGPEAGSIRRRIIDFAHGISEELASTLVSELDNDPARLQIKLKAKSQLKLLELKKTLIEEAFEVPHLSEYDARSVGQAAWMSLGSLLSGRTRKPVRIHRTHELVSIATRWPLTDAYPVLAWVIENATSQLRGDAGTKILRSLFNASILSVDLIGRMLQKTAARRRNPTPLVLPVSGLESLAVEPGERQKALRYLEAWLRKHANTYLKISDPFLGPEDVTTILQMILETNPALEVSFLTSKKHQPNSQDFEELYLREWRRSSDQDPPDTRISISGVRPGGDSPIHDRWWLTDKTGLRVGTSFNSLGVGKHSEISVMRDNEAKTCESKLDQFLFGVVRSLNGNKIDCKSFSLIGS